MMTDTALVVAMILLGLGGIGLAIVISAEEYLMEKTYSSDGHVVNKAKDFGGDVEPKK